MKKSLLLVLGFAAVLFVSSCRNQEAAPAAEEAPATEEAAPATEEAAPATEEAPAAESK
jgi:PBP1b-binding outer membrane lipoprotein LpoB